MHDCRPSSKHSRGRPVRGGLASELLALLVMMTITLGLSREEPFPPKPPPIQRDDLERAAFIADVELVNSFGFPPVLVNRTDDIGRTALMKCG